MPTIRMIQPAFTTGEISKEVANRVDLDQYKSALLQAKNCCIRPYGAVYKRTGTLFLGKTKYDNKKVILRPFNVSGGTQYLLEIGDRYLRIWKGDTLLKTEIVTPYAESELHALRFCQSADILYIASGTHPIMQLMHYSDSDWRFKEMDFTSMYFDSTLDTKTSKGTNITYGPGTYTYKPTESGWYDVAIAAGGGGGAGGTAEFVEKYTKRVHKRRVTRYRHKTISGGSGGNGGYISTAVYLTAGESYAISVGTGGTGGSVSTKSVYVTYNYDTEDDIYADSYTGNDGSSGGNTSAFGYTATGGAGGKADGTAGTSNGNGGKGGTGGTASSTTTEMSGSASAGAAGGNGYVTIAYKDALNLKPSGVKGQITLTTSRDFFDSDMAGTWMELTQKVSSQTVSTSGSQTSASVLVGSSWKIITHGTWTGEIKIQKSDDNGTWTDYRTYKSSNDFNASESGTVLEPCYMRLVSTAGNADLTALPYENNGTVKIVKVNNKRSATCRVYKPLANTGAVDGYKLGAWSESFGYPQVITFWQDRLILAATKAQPYNVWMSRTGDYYNFEVEKASGTITDDSAVCIAIISRKQQTIKHLIPASDLIIMTDGNEWIISGNDTVTPTKCIAKVQTTRGCTDVAPLYIGGRVVYVQRRGKTVRDMGYSYDTDSYSGMDLILLDKTMTINTEIIGATYMQDPDSRIYFALANGRIGSLAYIQEQKVYAWTELITDGTVLDVCDIEDEASDHVYIAVKRANGTYIERFAGMQDNDDPMEFIELDSAVKYEGEATSHISCPHLEGQKISVLADGREFDDITVTDGLAEIPASAKKIIAGIPFEMIIETPNLELSTETGSVQGRVKKVSGVTLRLVNSLGGYVGTKNTLLDQIKYEEMKQIVITLYSGDKAVTIPNYTKEMTGRVYIKSKDAYPFTLAAIVREVELN